METDPRYPIGPEPPFTASTPGTRAEQILVIGQLPSLVRASVSNLADAQLDTAYRPGGWTVRQVVHHLADSHMNAFVRLKLALTEDAPAIKPYNEASWAELADCLREVGTSLAILDGLHARWVALYRAMDDSQFARSFYHPERREQISLDRHLHMYAWHSRHHLGHITGVRRRLGW